MYIVKICQQQSPSQGKLIYVLLLTLVVVLTSNITLTKPIQMKRVSRWVKMFLFMGRMEERKESRRKEGRRVRGMVRREATRQEINAINSICKMGED